MTSFDTRSRDSAPARPVVIAEAGVNHDGSIDDAHALVDLAADAGADAVKFQTFDPSALVSSTAAAAAYQAANTGITNQRDLLDLYVLPVSVWPELRDHATERGLSFMSTAFDVASLDVICDLGVGALKLGSGELTNKPFLTELATRGLPVIVSTGMGTLDEVADAVAWLTGAPSIELMHCVSSYPAPTDQANLRAIITMREAFDVPVGWSDHTLGPVTALVAVALGASSLEKHITLDRSRPGPDHTASADAAGFTAYVEQVHIAAAALGDGTKTPAPAELDNIELVRRSWHATHDLAAGDTLTASDVTALRPASGITPGVDLVGCRIARLVRLGDPVTTDDLEAM